MLVILDRDGVINEDSPDYIKSPEEWIPIPGSLEAIACLNAAGHIVVLATNQAGVGRGYYTQEMLGHIHQKMADELHAKGARLDGIYTCVHHPDDQCICRKPRPGMLLAIKEKYPNSFEDAFFVGDSLRDVQAAQAAGCQPVLVRTGNGEKTLAAAKLDLAGVLVFDDLADVVNRILSELE